MLRTLTERLTRDWVVQRRLPSDFASAPLHVSPSAGLRYLFRTMDAVDPVLLELVREFVAPGAVVWDVGANVGLFAFAAASMAGPDGHVLALEPDIWLAQLLRKSASRQPPSSARVQVVSAAVASALSIRTLCLANRSRAANYLAEFGTIQTGGSCEEQSVVAVTLDWLLESCPAPTVLKIDVEGAELEVLKGSRRLLETARPTILCEVCPDSASAVAELLFSCNYRLFDGEKPAAERHALETAPWSTVALPASGAAEELLRDANK